MFNKEGEIENNMFMQTLRNTSPIKVLDNIIKTCRNNDKDDDDDVMMTILMTDECLVKVRRELLYCYYYNYKDFFSSYNKISCSNKFT